MKLGRRLGLPFPTFLGVLGSGIRFNKKKKKKKKKRKEKCQSLVCQHNHVVSAGHYSEVRLDFCLGTIWRFLRYPVYGLIVLLYPAGYRIFLKFREIA